MNVEGVDDPNDQRYCAMAFWIGSLEFTWICNVFYLWSLMAVYLNLVVFFICGFLHLTLIIFYV